MAGERGTGRRRGDGEVRTPVWTGAQGEEGGQARKGIMERGLLREGGLGWSRERGLVELGGKG